MTRRFGGDPRAGAAFDAEVARGEATAARWRARWGEGGDEAMRRLVRSFPTLRDAEGADPWDVERFLAWARRGETSAGASCAARFVLGVWNPRCDWRALADALGLPGIDPLEPFSLFEAVAVWDPDHVRAFAAWVELPFWP